MSERTIIHIEEDEEGGGLKVDAHAPSAVLFASANALMELAVRGLIADGLKTLIADQVNGEKSKLIVAGRKN